MNKSESKYFNTAQIMDEALIELLEKKDFEYITVKELCEKAGVNRSTFYLHYESMNDLLEETMEMTNKAYERSFPFSHKEVQERIKNADIEDLIFINPEYLIPYLKFVQSNKRIFMAAGRNPRNMKVQDRFGAICKDILVPIYKRFNIPEKEHEYLIDFYIQGTHSIVDRWIHNDCRETAEELMDIIIRCVRPEIPKTLKE